MKKACFVFLGFAALLAGVNQATAADESVDSRKLRDLHQRVKSGEKLSPEDQAYYDRGRVARRKGDVGKPASESTTTTTTATSASGAGKTSTGMVPLSDMTAEARYKGEDGGLYGAGRNTPPDGHLKAALEIAAKIQPLDASGKPSPDGRIVFLTHGMSNTTNESVRFIEVASGDPRKNPALILIDGAQGGMDSRKWVADTHTRRDTSPWETLDKRVKAAGATAQQVQVIWMKHALARVAQYGEFPKHTKKLRDDTETIIHMLKDRFPNLKLVYLSSRSYAGYANSELNPEPFAYESAFAVRSLIQDQIKGTESLNHANGKTPLLLWGPYIWANGEKGRKAGDLVYRREDFRDDGTHPSDSGRQKVAEQLLRFFTTDPTAAAWFIKH